MQRMGLFSMAGRFRINKRLPYCLYGEILDQTQQLRIEPVVLKCFMKNRQLTPHAKEAGGQLFGLVDPQCIWVKQAAGPYRGDERSRTHHRSCPISAQRAIDHQSKNGLLYLGEWHTHPESKPSPSDSDINAMRTICTESILNTDSLLMIIVGDSEEINGIGVWTVSNFSVSRWRLSM